MLTIAYLPRKKKFFCSVLVMNVSQINADLLKSTRYQRYKSIRPLGKVYDDVIYYIVCFIIIVAFITNGTRSTMIVLLHLLIGL